MISRRNAIGWLIATLLLISSTSIHLITNDEGEDVIFEEVAKRSYSNILVERNLVITDNETWTNLWSDIHWTDVPPPPLPPVDFSHEWLIGVFLGARSDGGYDVNITKIGRTQFYYKVFYDELDWQGGATMAETQPFQIVKISSVLPNLQVHFIYNYVQVYPMEQ